MSEAVVRMNPHGQTSVAQGSEIPLGWVATPRAPVPVVRCIHIKKNGKRCEAWGMRGMRKCWAHGGRKNFPDVEKYRLAVVESARMRLLDDTHMAVDTIEHLMKHGTAESIMLKAATETLDRAGIKGGFDIKIDANITVNSAETVSERLLKLAEGAAAVKKMRDEEMDIVDGEVIEDDEDDPTLF